jgi:hypothetical protein
MESINRDSRSNLTELEENVWGGAIIYSSSSVVSDATGQQNVNNPTLMQENETLL